VTPSISDEWIADGCHEVRRLLERGQPAGAILTAAYIERSVLAEMRERREREEADRRAETYRPRAHCQATGCNRWARGGWARWCDRHEPGKVHRHRCTSCRRVDEEGAPDADGAWVWVCKACWGKEARRNG
jgi:hypothetical protein